MYDVAMIYVNGIQEFYRNEDELIYIIRENMGNDVANAVQDIKDERDEALS